MTEAENQELIRLKKEIENLRYKWVKLFAGKRFKTKDGNIKLTPLEQHELITDIEKLDKEKHWPEASIYKIPIKNT